jgi:hypothetical protein
MTGPKAISTGVVILAAIAENAAALLRNPTLGIDGAEKIASLLHFAANGFTNGSDALTELQAVNQQLISLVDEGRAPNDEEWATWEERFDGVDTRFQRVKEELEKEEGTTE